MTDRLRVSTRTARSKGYARINNNPAFYAGMVFCPHAAASCDTIKFTERAEMNQRSGMQKYERKTKEDRTVMAIC